jgi:perosamine synthetase
MTLAIDGGKPAITEPVQSTTFIGHDEARAAYNAVAKYPLSGFLGGQPRGGYFVSKLEDLWAERFRTKHAIACNSATSGLLAACAAVGIDRIHKTVVPCFTMSATAAAPALLGADLQFADCDNDYFCLHAGSWPDTTAGVIVTNLFGHPAELARIRQACNRQGIWMIEDNAQAIGAMEGDRYAGTVGEIGVYSLNVHKSIQAGEGGVCVTDDDGLADCLRRFINHGELAAGSREIGLNLRMTEVTAAIAIEQLRKLDEITLAYTDQAEALTVMARGMPWLDPPKVRDGCKHVYYCWAVKVDTKRMDRDRVVAALNAEGFPAHAGYVEPLYHLPAFHSFYRECPTATRLHEKDLIIFENTLYALSTKQINQFGDALLKIEKAYLR